MSTSTRSRKRTWLALGAGVGLIGLSWWGLARRRAIRQVSPTVLSALDHRSTVIARR